MTRPEISPRPDAKRTSPPARPIGRWTGAALLTMASAALAVILAMLALSQNASAQGLRFIRDAEIEETLNDYAKPIFEAAGLGSQRIRVRVVNDKAFNAFVLDGKNVFINSGAILQAKTPNEIIGVIAHESGHIKGGHLAGLRRKVQQDATRNMLLKVLGIGAMIAGAASNNEDTQQLATGGQGILLGADEITIRSILSYQRVHELAADQAGITYLTATRQSGRGMLATFERFAEQELFTDPRFKDPYVRSHPMARDRLSQLRTLVEQSPYYGATDSEELQLRHDLMRAKLSGYMEKPQTVLGRYPASDTSLPAKYARAIATFNSKGIEEALPLIDQLIKVRPDYAYFYEVKGDLLLRKGDAARAVPPLRKARQLSDHGLIRIELAEALLRSGDRGVVDEAIDLLQKALVQEEHSGGYRQLANAFYQRGEEGLAYLATARASLLEGKLADAKAFAKRSQTFFPSGSPNWIKADDIITLKASG